jgi:hypothetical protein
VKRFLLLYNGPPAPPQATHEGWPEWFEKTGDALVDLGSPMANGFGFRGVGSTSEETTSLNGYCIVQAEERGRLIDLISDHPFLALGHDYVIEVFEVPRR